MARRPSKVRGAKRGRLAFERGRRKDWRFGAKTEAMNAEQRQMFEETLAEDQASLQAQLQALQGEFAPSSVPPAGETKRKPRRQALPEHLRRVEHHHEPENTTCECGAAKLRRQACSSARIQT